MKSRGFGDTNPDAASGLGCNNAWVESELWDFEARLGAHARPGRADRSSQTRADFAQ